jgi:septum formation protein
MSMLVLASSSPRRIEMLRSAAIPHAVWPVDVDETPLVGESAEALVLRLSQNKADAAAARAVVGPPVLGILGADTIVVAGGALLGKPPHEGAARQMLALLSGQTHEVVTGYHLRYLDAQDGTLRRCGRAVRTRVQVRPLQPADTEGYLRSQEWRGKAGAYAIQGRFNCFVQEIAGSYENVVGLPLCQVIVDLQAAGILPAGWPSWQP